MKQTSQPKGKDINHAWHEVDANGQALGRLSSHIAGLLMGKNKTNYAPHLDMGDWVVVKNAKAVKLTGRKDKQKVYYRHSGYPKGFKEIKVEKLRVEQPEKIIIHAVKGMLPVNRLRDKRMARLKVFAGDKHPFQNKLENKQV